MSGNQNISFEKYKKGQSTDIKTKKARVKESVPTIFTDPLNSLTQEQIKAVARKKAEQVCAIEDDINTTNKLNHSLYKEIYFASREKCEEFLENFFTAFIEQNKNVLTNTQIENLFSHNKGYVVKLKALLLLYANIDNFDMKDFHTFCEISTRQGTFLFTAVISYLRTAGKRTNVFTAKKFMSSDNILKLYTKFKEIKKFISDYFHENLSTLDIEEKLKDTSIQEQLKNLNIEDWGADQIKYCVYYIKGIDIHKPCNNPPLEELIISFNESQKSGMLKRSRHDFEQFEDNAEVAADSSSKRAFLPQYMASSNSSNQYTTWNSSMPISTSLAYNSMPNILSSYNLNPMIGSMSGGNLRPMFPLLPSNYIHRTSILAPDNSNPNITFSSTNAPLTFSSNPLLV